MPAHVDLEPPAEAVQIPEKINIWCLINEYNNSCITMKNGIIDSNYLFLLSN